MCCRRQVVMELMRVAVPPSIQRFNAKLELGVLLIIT